MNASCPRTTLPVLLGLCVVLTTGLPAHAGEPPEPEAPVAGRPDAGQGEIDRLVANLGAPEYARRVAAFQRLIEIGEPARAALEKAMQDAESPETRWRAEQILSRLDRERERPMDAGVFPPAPRPGERPPNPPGSRLEELERRWEKMREQLEKDFGFFGPIERSETLTAPGLKLEISSFGMIPKVALHVEAEKKDAAGPPRPKVYRARQLEEILARHPELERHAGMAALKDKWGAFKRRNKAMFPEELFRMHAGLGPGAGVRFFGGSQGVHIAQTPDGVRVKLTERDENGKLVVKEYEAESLEQLKRDHPELEDKLGISVRVMPTQIFPPRRRLGGRIMPPVLPPAVTPAEKTSPDPDSVFGVEVTSPEPALAAHLEVLEPGHGLLVHEVARGSRADAIGVEPYDIILAVNGKSIESARMGRRMLHEAVRSRGRLTLDVLRHGERIELAR